MVSVLHIGRVTAKITFCLLFRQLQHVIGRLSTAQSELQDERQMNHALQQNQSAWQSKFQALEKQFNEYRLDKDKVKYHIFLSISLIIHMESVHALFANFFFQYMDLPILGFLS
jgi:hypothetical protein